MNIKLETFTGIRDVWDEFSEKIFGTKILTDGDVQKQSEEFFDKKTINMDEYTISRTNRIVKNTYDIKNASYVVTVNYIVPIYSNDDINYKIEKVYLNKQDKMTLKKIKTHLLGLSDRLKYSDFKIKRLSKQTNREPKK